MFSFLYKFLIVIVMALCIQVVITGNSFAITLVAIVCFIELVQRLLITLWVESERGTNE